MNTLVSNIRRSLLDACTVMMVVLALSSTALFGQGTLAFKNFGAPGLNAPVYLPDGVTKLSWPEFSALLLAGPSSSSLALIDKTPFTNSPSGYFDAGVETIPDLPAGSNAVVMVSFWLTKDYPSIAPFGPAMQLYPWILGNSPMFSATTGDSANPGLLFALGTSPIILATPILVVRQTDTNTLAFSFNYPTNRYVLCGKYLLQQSSDLNQSNWTAVDFTNIINGMPRPSTATFYRLALQ